MQHKKPCSECPWRRASAAGWLGSSTPLEFANQAESGIRMPCHLAVDYEREDWEEQADVAPQCAGRAVYMANRCKSQPGLLKVPADRAEVFSNVQEFLAHHMHGKAPNVMILGDRVVELK
ncbi:hypothetical protein [Herbaspirillum huttiense]|uniref:Uncharacterized protein n=1 Tax=Herbaspirillum huttiense subsp. lycopersici TaxID=3074428 RepID=A0ABU2EGV1_9BURK|nr:hypothetical protein [Herbaspirillum huttiense]MDR9847088.1 hypothetical protein [Herbaspirillum huttiense SE1]